MNLFVDSRCVAPGPDAKLTSDRWQMVVAFEAMARSIARRLCPPDASRLRREQRIEDIYGEAMLAATECARGFDPDGRAKFSTVAYAYVTQRVRRVIDEQRLASLHATGIDFARFSRTPGDDEPADDAAPCECHMSEADRELLGRLPGQMRACVALVIAGGFTPDQVATQLGMETKNVKLLLRNAGRILATERKKLEAPNLFGGMNDAG